MHCCLLQLNFGCGRRKGRRLELELHGFLLGGTPDSQIRVGSVRCSKGRGDNRYFIPQNMTVCKIVSMIHLPEEK